jgi:alkylation response protein AidB-like acyl-CoA dehydrogenase
VVFAVTNPDLVAQRRGGISCFLVPATSEGYSVPSVLAVMGHPASDCGTIALDDVRVPNDHLIGEVDQGFRISMMGISEGRSPSRRAAWMSEWALDLAGVREGAQDVWPAVGGTPAIIHARRVRDRYLYGQTDRIEDGAART